MFICICASSNFDISSLTKLNAIYSNRYKADRVVHIYVKIDDKPVSDSFHQVEDEKVFLFDGILANSQDLVNKYALPDTRTLLKTALLHNPSDYVAQFHGQFCGLYFSLQEDILRIFTNQTNTVRVYYYEINGILIAGTSLKMIHKLLQDNGISASIDEIGSRMILSFGFTLSDFTTIKEIKQLGAGRCIEYLSEKLSVYSYHQFNNDILHNNLSENLPILNELFKKAVSCAFNKDVEHGKEHLAFLSGGLDSRQTVFTAKQLGYTRFTCLNFSQPGYADETIAKQIITELGLESIFYPLTKGTYLLNIDNNLQYNEGQIILHGAAHLFEAISSIDLDKYGILHSGQLGDVIFGSYLTSSKHDTINFYRGAYSSQLLESILPDIMPLQKQYPNHELYLLYNRGFNAIMNGDLACSLKSFSISPFLYPEFAQYGFNINPKFRYNSQCYFSWMKKFDPVAAKFVWEKTGSNLFTPVIVSQLKYMIHRVMNKVYRTITHSPNKNSMNPFDYWWKENSKLRDYFTPQLCVPEALTTKISPELHKDMLLLMAKESFSEKLQVYTLIKGLEYLGF